MSEILLLDFQHKTSARGETSRVGQLGERLAARFLIKSGYRLIVRNFKTPIGRNRIGASVSGEIDLIALDGRVLCFVEVKTRSSEAFASPLAAVDLRKQRQITRTAKVYRKIFNLRDAGFRFDVVSIVLGDANEPKIELIKNFWSEAKFRKRFWADDL